MKKTNILRQIGLIQKSSILVIVVLFLNILAAALLGSAPLLCSLIPSAITMLYVITSHKLLRMACVYTLKEGKELEKEIQKAGKELEEAHTQLEKSERLVSMGTIASGIAHELNNPLNCILLNAEVGLRIKDHAPLYPILRSIKAEAQRGGAVIKSILKFAKHEKGHQSICDLNVVIMKAVDLAKVYIADGLQIKTNLQEGLSRIPLNAVEIEQVIINLVKNAHEAAPVDNLIEIFTKEDNHCVEVGVKDSGPGIPPDKLNHIFDPFFSTKSSSGGTGLGLNIVYNVVTKNYGGSIKVDSKPGQGTLFRILLPKDHRYESNIGG